MANPPKKKGTARETAHVNKLNAAHIEARRDENNNPSSDVIVRIGDQIVRVEVKDRQNLNAHKVMKEMQELYPDDFNVVLWHRTSTKKGNSRRSPDGPTLVHLTEDDWIRIVRLIDRVRKAAKVAAENSDDQWLQQQLLEWIGEALP